ncbi:MAG: peroxide stress protein YaaA [Clostridium sp.]
MIIVISPAKTLEMNTKEHNFKVSEPRYLYRSEKIMDELKKLQPNEIGKLMKISIKLSELNYLRNGAWSKENHLNETPCIFAFKGDVYKGINIEEYSEDDIEYANSHLRILSGLYGILRPLDGIHEYRLEMGTKLKVGEKKNLYDYWGEDFLREEILNDAKENGSEVIINLASEEYSKVLNLNKLPKDKLLNIMFKEFKNGEYKIVGIYAKKARGLMTSYILKNKVKNVEDIKNFSEEGYKFNRELSSDNEFVFTRI